MSRHHLEFTLNGRPCAVYVDPGASLLDILRDDLGLTGTKRGCSEGECGACTVLVDGVPVDSCLYPAVKATGATVLTIEGMGDATRLHPIQQAFIDAGAVQCGYCTPGMVLKAKALLDQDPDPDEQAIRQAISGNLCRCTGYSKIVDAVQRAAQNLGDAATTAIAAASATTTTGVATPAPDLSPALTAGATPPLSAASASQAEAAPSVHSAAVSPAAATLGHVGTSVPRLDAVPKVLGEARFGDDLYVPGMLHAKVLRSPHAHALIRSIDTTKAEALPGVWGVVTSANVPGRMTYGIIMKDQPYLAHGKVRFIGEAVAAVAAETPAIAGEALKLIDVDYEPLPPVFTVEEALADGAPLVHGKGNLLLKRSVRKGDPAAAFAEAAHVVEGTFRTPLIEHAYLEPEAGLAMLDEGGLLIHSVSQGVHYQRGEIAAMLSWPVNRVRLKQATVGGAFGGKIDLSVHPYISLLAVKTRRPVKLVYTRAESMLATPKRHPITVTMKLGADTSGRLIAGEARIAADSGAYASYSFAVVTRCAVSAFGPYSVQNATVDAFAAYTNNPIAGAMRGFGTPQLAFASEQLMDMLAAKAGLSPLEVRRLNGYQRGQSTTLTRQVIGDPEGFLETLEAATEASLEWAAAVGATVSGDPDTAPADSDAPPKAAGHQGGDPR